MRRSISSRNVSDPVRTRRFSPKVEARSHRFFDSWVSLALALFFSSVPSTFADDYTDDSAIKASFETRLGELYAAGGLPTATETIRELRSEKIATAVLPETVPSTEAEAISRARNATLLVGHLYLCGKCDKYHASLAGGVLISPDGLALTNYHVLESKEAIVFGAMAEDGRVFAIGEVLASSKRDDLALVRLRGAEALPHVSLCETVATGEEVFVVSHPDGYFYSLTRGYLSRKYLTAKEKIPRLQITADFAKGSSGSGIFNRAGELVGLAASTNSIYYKTDGETPGNLQMVLKSGVPTESILKLLRPTVP